MSDALTRYGSFNCECSTSTITEHCSNPALGNELPAALKDLLPRKHPDLYSPWLDISTISPSNIVLASLWLQNCLQHHQPCSDAQAQSVLPTRVIDVSDPDHPVLIKGGGWQDRYVTLSYKWGGARKFTTTIANLQRHELSIPFKHLPRTFKEAIYVTYSLGFRWLWIDALCIVQDSTEKLREIERMGLVFRRSTLTLFAASGDNADAGLSVMRDPRTVRPCRLEVRTTLNNTTVVNPSHITLKYQKGALAPLFTRGWVLQEEVLSVRGLYFGPEQLGWCCLCDNSSETSPQPRKQVRSSKSLGTPQSYWEAFRLAPAAIESSEYIQLQQSRRHGDSHFDEWYSTVQRYSDRILTFSSDTLFALSGIASTTSSMHNCTYLAGLWKEDLQLGLCWFVTSGKRPVLKTGDQEPNNRKRNAAQPLWLRLLQRFYRSQDLPNQKSVEYPSWSWASKWGKTIRFDLPRQDHPRNHIKHEGVAFVDEHFRERASAQNPFSTVTQSALKLIGRLRVATAVLPKQVAKQYQSNADRVREVRDPVSGKIIGVVAFDTALRTLRARQIHCLLCAVHEWNGEWDLMCLALNPKVGAEGHFTRVGRVHLSDPLWFGELSIADPAERPYSPPRDTRFLRMITLV